MFLSTTMMFKTVDLAKNPAYWKVHAVIRFLWCRNLKFADIHHRICAVYGKNIMSGSAVRQGATFFGVY